MILYSDWICKSGSCGWLVLSLSGMPHQHRENMGLYSIQFRNNTPHLHGNCTYISSVTVFKRQNAYVQYIKGSHKEKCLQDIYLNVIHWIFNMDKQHHSKLINYFFYHSVQSLLSSRLLSRNVKLKIYKTIILPVVLNGCETLCLTLREEHWLRVFENRF
jgi:hypothetical protein